VILKPVVGEAAGPIASRTKGKKRTDTPEDLEDVGIFLLF
jgi:hypothetical protein